MMQSEPATGDEQSFRLLVQSVKDHAIYMLDRSGKVKSWNPGAQRFKGYAAGEIIGRHFSCFYTPEERASGVPWQALATAEREGRFEAEGWRLRKDGRRFWARVVIEPVLSDDGALVGFAKVTRDLTDQLTARQALEEAREALFHSQKMETIGQFAGGVAHDFNNLLGAIMGNLDLAMSHLEGAGLVPRLLGNAMMAAERGAALTQRMLAFARKQDLDIKEVDIAALLADVSDTFARALGDAASVEVDVPAGLPRVRADPVQLELAVSNLVTNARDAMPGGGIIRIVAAFEPPSAGHPEADRFVRLSVIDRGRGMKPHVLRRAAEPFFTTKDTSGGSGLGLSMVHGFAEQCGGRLSLASVEGEGTTAELWLRAVEPIERDDVSYGGRPALPADATLRILLVDDDPLVLASTADMLDMLDHAVVAVTSATEALDLLTTGNFDILVTDFMMPEMTGGQLAQVARETKPDLPILLVSGFADLPPGTPKLERLRKPFTLERLADAVGRARRSGYATGLQQ